MFLTYGLLVSYEPWSILTTWLMVIPSIKDPKIMVIVNPNHWMTSSYYWLLTMSIDHSSYTIVPINIPFPYI